MKGCRLLAWWALASLACLQQTILLSAKIHWGINGKRPDVAFGTKAILHKGLVILHGGDTQLSRPQKTIRVFNLNARMFSEVPLPDSFGYAPASLGMVKAGDVALILRE